MSECPRFKKTKCAKEQRKVKGWSLLVEEDTEEKKNGQG